MIPIIGTMIGVYCFCKLVDLAAKPENEQRFVGYMHAIGAIVLVFLMLFLWTGPKT